MGVSTGTNKLQELRQIRRGKMTQKGKCEYRGLVLINGSRGKGWGRTSRSDFVYFDFYVMCLFISYCAVSVQMTILTVCCLLPETDLTALLLSADLWLM